MCASTPSSSAVTVSAILRLTVFARASPHPMSCSPTWLMALSSAAVCHLLGRSCNLFIRCAVKTAEPPQHRYVSCASLTAGKLPVEHSLAIFSRRSDLRRVLCTHAESWCARQPRVVVYDAGEAAIDISG